MVKTPIGHYNFTLSTSCSFFASTTMVIPLTPILSYTFLTVLGANSPATPGERTVREERGRQAREIGPCLQAQAKHEGPDFLGLGRYV